MVKYKGAVHLLFVALLVIPLLGVLYFLNLTVFLKNLKNGKSTRNQTILGSVLTFIFIFSLMFFYIGTH